MITILILFACWMAGILVGYFVETKTLRGFKPLEKWQMFVQSAFIGLLLSLLGYEYGWHEVLVFALFGVAGFVYQRFYRLIDKWDDHG